MCPSFSCEILLKLDLAVHMWLCCHGDSEYRLDDQWLRGKCMSTKQLVALHEQPLAGLIPIPPKYKALLLNHQAGYLLSVFLSLGH